MSGDHGLKLDASTPHSARVWNYWLGGKDNFEIDRVVGEQVRSVYPEIALIARESRAFLGRAVRFLAGEAGVRQFLDLGTGLPTADNTHEVAQKVAADSRVVYVDNDPLVLTHARALLTSSPEGATDFINADVRDPEKILAEAARTLDFSQPVAVMMLGILGNVMDDGEARSIVDRLMSAVPSGSYLVINDGTDGNDRGVEGARIRGDAGDPYCLRSPALLARFFDGLELLDPGVVTTSRWRHDPESAELGALAVACGVARKP
jgi:hypothetical protein